MIWHCQTHCVPFLSKTHSHHHQQHLKQAGIVVTGWQTLAIRHRLEQVTHAWLLPCWPCVVWLLSPQVRSPKRLQVRFERGSIATPQLLSDVEVPASVSVLGQTVDLSQLQGLLQPVSQGLSGILSQVREGKAGRMAASLAPCSSVVVRGQQRADCRTSASLLAKFKLCQEAA